MSQEREIPVSTLILTFLAGAAVGAVAAALVTPKSGPELRGDLKDLALNPGRKLKDWAGQAGAAWDGIKERTAMAATDLQRGASDAINDLRA
ncbi:MAG: YtxH domain-containing protein [Holophaga sp.]|jgi:gas vesicle protein